MLTHGTPSITPAIADALVFKDRDLFLLTEPDGRMPRERAHGLGLYYHDCRYLRTYEFLIDGVLPVCLGAGAGAGYRGSVQLTNPDLRRPDKPDIPRETLGIEWTHVVDGEALVLADTIALYNWGHDPVELTLEFWFAAGFEDVFQVRGLLAERLGQEDVPRWSDHVLRFRYHGKDGVTRAVGVIVPAELVPTGACSASTTFRIEAREQRRLELRLLVEESLHAEGNPEGDGDRLRRSVFGAPTRLADPWPGGIAKVASDSIALNEVLGRSFADLQLLKSTLRGRTFVAAGIPWFVTLFGRDSLIASLQLLAYAPAIAAETLRLLASFQGDKIDHWRDEAPGKMPHEVRVGEMACTGEIPHTPYYGTVDATPLFLLVLTRYVAWTGDLALFDELRDHVRRALDWIDRYGDPDGDGYVEYRSASEHGLVNQGWKDSGDGIVDEMGRIATPPIALIEVQAYVYAAKMGLADLLARGGDEQSARKLRGEAEALRTRVNRDFWVESLGCYAMALEAKKTPLNVISSNPGHALWCGVADVTRATRIADRLMADDMFSGWGVRTLSRDAQAYTPIGYHLGTVWPHDNAFVAAGFKRYGFATMARGIFDGLAEAALDFDHARLPELFTGFSKQQYGAPIRYPVACHPQAWSAGALPFLLEQLLGLVPSARDHRLRIVQPVLPSYVRTLELEGVRIGGATVHLRFDRDGDARDANTNVQVVALQGDLEVRIEQTQPSEPAIAAL